MRIVKLQDVVDQIRGVSYKKDQVFSEPLENTVPLFRANNISDTGLNNNDLYYVLKKVVKEKQILRKGDVLIAASSGSKKIVGKSSQYINDDSRTFGAFCKVLRPKSNINPSYLKHFFNTSYYRKTISSVVNGANINNLSIKDIDELKIPLPDLQTQQKIADALDKADAIRRRNKEILQKYDDLAQSIFLEMFGDPVRNEKGWEVATVEEICTTIFGGGTPSKSKPNYYAGTIPWVTPKDMKSRIIKNSIDKITQEAIENSSTKLIPSNSVLMVIRSGILKKQLPVAINDVEVTLNQDMKAFICNKTIITTEFLFYFFHTVQKFLLAKVRGVTADNIEFKQIKELPIPVPPIAIQIKFSEIFKNIEIQKDCQKQAIRYNENLFQSLLQKAFKGELFKPEYIYS